MRKIFPYLITLFLSLSVLACAQDVALQIMRSCAMATSGLKMATALKAQGKLSPVQIAQVDEFVLVVDPICGSEAIVNPDIALMSLEQQLLVLNGVVIEAAR